MTRPLSPAAQTVRHAYSHSFQCEFCKEPAVWKNCFFYPDLHEDCVSGPFNLCEIHLIKMADERGSTGEELSIDPLETDLQEAER